MRPALLRIVRAEQWWSYKLAPILAVFYASLLREGAAIAAVAVDAAILLFALVAGAAWVSLSNDLADRDDDRAAAKPNRLEGKSPVTIAVLLALPLAGGATVAWLWREDPLLLLAYGAAWLAFALYSLPPFRLKAHGIPGVIADAAGSQALPSLVAALAASHALGRAPDLLWCLVVTLWAGAWGVRGIVWHQLLDRAADEASATGTFVRRHGVRRARALVRLVTFPVELAALLALLWMIPGRASMFALALYALLTVARMERFQLRAALADPVERYLLLLGDFYAVFWPLALLAAASATHPQDLLVLAVHLLLFLGPAWTVVHDAMRLPRRNLGGPGA